MAEIRVLSKHLVNKIAAGEVIERPASVVKELLENALDAGATRIDLSVEEGGRKLVRVTDDGGGMSAEDLALAFRPHATSKIADDEDLFAIRTMGFRGEALASVASISHAHIRTRRPDEPGGHEVSAGGDEVGEVRPCAAAPGTTVTVKDLFFNTPARRKFLRTVNTEFGHVTEQFARLSLPHPRVAFTLTHNGREVQNLPAVEATTRRARDLFGDDLADALLPVRPRGGGVKIAGLLAPPAAARGSGKWQYFFLNGRYVRDPVLAHALREAYRGLVDPNRRPVALLFLEVDPAAVDVNVHPTKIEVRFHDSQRVHGELLAALRYTLNHANLTPAASLDRAEAFDDSPPQSPDEQRRRQGLREALADFFKSVPPQQPSFSDLPAAGGRPGGPAHAHATHERAGAPVASPRSDPFPPAADGQAPPAPLPAAATIPPATLQVHDAYLITADADGLLIVDQHALHERVLYNQFRRRLTAGPLTAQRMLIPETVSLTAEESAALTDAADLLARLGIEVTAFGPDSVAVQQFPALLVARKVPVGEFIRELLDKLREGLPDPERILEELLEMMACKAAVKAGDPLSPEEIDDLLAARDTVEKASSCPHGRPTTIKLSLKDLEKQFKRT